MIGAPPAGGGDTNTRQARGEAWTSSVTMQRKFQQSKPIVFGSASVSIHRQSVGHSCYAAETGTHSANCAVGVVALSTCPLLCLTSA